MKGDKVSLVKSDSLGSKEGYSNGSKTIKKYANMSDEMEQLDIETSELLARIRASAEALEWDTNKVALSKENKELEFKKIKAEMDKARTKLQVSTQSQKAVLLAFLVYMHFFAELQSGAERAKPT